MEPIHQMTNNIQTQLREGHSDCGTSAQKDLRERTSLPDRYTKQVFARLHSICGHRWDSRFPDKASIAVAKGEWGHSLAKLSNWQIKNGLDKVRDIPNWWPDAADFIRLACSLPDVETAISRVLNKTVIDPITREIISKIGSFQLRRLSISAIERRAKALYADAYLVGLNEVAGMLGEWRPPQQLEHEGENKYKEEATPMEKQHSHTIAKKNIAEIRRALLENTEKQQVGKAA